jgi:hypothetical protein
VSCPLPSLEEPPAGTACEHCGLELRVEGFCPECFEHSMQVREVAIREQLKQARRRARTWQLGRAVQQ